MGWKWEVITYILRNMHGKKIINDVPYILISQIG